MRLTYFGHSAFQLEIGSSTILVDPFITGNPLAKGKIDPRELNPKYILVSHAHGDHWGDTLEIAKRSQAYVVSNFEIAQYLEKHGHTRVYDMNIGGSVQLEWGRLTMINALHSSSFPDGTYGGNPCGYLIHAEGKSVYYTGDTCPFLEMAWIGEDQPVDVVLMPVGDYFTMGPADSIRVARMINPVLTIPLHFNTFPPIKIDIKVWEREMNTAGFATKIMNSGETTDI